MASATSIDLVQTLSQQHGLQELPRRFVQPPEKRSSVDLSDHTPSIPLVDLQASPQSFISQQIAHSCQEWGFFQIVNHGISLSLLEKVKNVVKTFLDLPMVEKLKRPIKYEPYHPTGYGRLFDLSEDSILDWVDALIHYLSPSALKDQDYWPASPEDYRETMETYGTEVRKLVRTLLVILSGNLGLRPHDLENAFGGQNAQVILRVNHYPRCPQSDLVMGLSPHSDGSAITVLLQDDVEGLQVKNDGQWCTVKPLSGALIVNLGDMMQLISNGKFISAEHRAVVRKDRDRTSIVVFYAPNVDAVIGPTAPHNDQPFFPRYKEIRYGDYLATYMNNELKGKARINSLLIKDCTQSKQAEPGILSCVACERILQGECLF